MKPFLYVGLFLYSITLFAGAGGAGNTNDASLEFDFARSTAVQILQTVTPKALFEASGREPIRNFYEACRSTLFTGAVQTRFELVSSISDGGTFHALAQRLPNFTIRISRTEMEKLQKAGALTGSFLTALVLHEVGHDCVYQGKPTGDDSDALLNDLAESLIRAADHRASSHMLDLRFIEHVKANVPVRFVDLSSRVRKAITEKYMDYVGDWAFLMNRAQFVDRPAPGSQYFADPNTSLFPGWSSSLTPASSRPLQLFSRNILKACYETGSLSYFDGKTNKPLPVELQCLALPPDGVTAECRLSVSWNPLADSILSPMRQAIQFRVDLFGNLTIQKVSILN